LDIDNKSKSEKKIKFNEKEDVIPASFEHNANTSGNNIEKDNSKTLPEINSQAKENFVRSESKNLPKNFKIDLRKVEKIGSIIQETSLIRQKSGFRNSSRKQTQITVQIDSNNNIDDNPIDTKSDNENKMQNDQNLNLPNDGERKYRINLDVLRSISIAKQLNAKVIYFIYNKLQKENENYLKMLYQNELKQRQKKLRNKKETINMKDGLDVNKIQSKIEDYEKLKNVKMREKKVINGIYQSSYSNQSSLENSKGDAISYNKDDFKIPSTKRKTDKKGTNTSEKIENNVRKNKAFQNPKNQQSLKDE
jgi:hypothetical protein